MKNISDKQTDSNHKPGKLKRIAKAIGNVLFVVLILTIAIFLFFAVQIKMAGGSPKIAGYNLYIVLSGSMEPALHTGSLVFVKPTQADSLSVNDMITFKNSGSDKLITHRIVAVNQEKQLTFITKGDANDVNDPQPLPAMDVVGKVSFTLPYVGYVMDFSRSKMGLLVLVIIPGVLMILLEMRKLYQYSIQLDKERSAKIRAELETKIAAERGEASAEVL